MKTIGPWRALRGALKKLARDLQYRTPPHNRPLRYILLEHEQAAVLLGYITLKLDRGGFAGWQHVGLDDGAMRNVLRTAEKFEAWAHFLEQWYRQQEMIDALRQNQITVLDNKDRTRLAALPPERRTELIDDLITAATNLRMLARRPDDL